MDTVEPLVAGFSSHAVGGSWFLHQRVLPADPVLVAAERQSWLSESFISIYLQDQSVDILVEACSVFVKFHAGTRWIYSDDYVEAPAKFLGR